MLDCNYKDDYELWIGKVDYHFSTVKEAYLYYLEYFATKEDFEYYKDYAVSKEAAEKVDAMLKTLEKIQGYTAKKYFITKENLDYLRNKNIEHYTTEQSKVCGKWFDKLAEEIFNYIIDGSEEISFLKYFDNNGHYKGN